MAGEDIHTIRGFRKDRAEALTDGIFATVMTILILSLVVPVITSGNVDQMLSSDLIGLVPNVVTYVMSFLVLGTIWIGHNNIFRYLERAEGKVQWINMAFLLGVGFIPFTTALLGRYPFDHTALLIYGINLLAIAIVYNFFFGYVAYQVLFSNPPHEQIIVVTGIANTIGLGTTPTSISFTSGAGAYYSTVAYGRYAISLPAHQAYNVTISWKSIAGLTAGTCHAGGFSPSLNSTLMSYNATC